MDRRRQLRSRCAASLCSGALGLGLFASAARAEEPAKEPEAITDRIELRDGRQVRGRVLENEPGRWVTLETEDGHRRTIAWEAIAELDLAAGIRAPDDESVRAWRARRGGATFEVRGAITAMAMPSQTFGLTGSCATGGGVAPASIYGQTATAEERAGGVGVGGRVAYMHFLTLDPRASPRWWALRAGTGLDLHVLYANTPAGIPPIDGELCSTVSTRSHDVVFETSAFLVAQIPLHLGAHWGLGSFDDMVWRGIVLGLAWAPSWTFLGPGSAARGGHLSFLAAEATVDFVALHALSERRPNPHFRVAFSLTVPVEDRQLLIGTLGLGAVWY
ncbi:MAG: hypothetical protein KF819_27195 [Labilithrix sp.]|nr:hypothetical protein [Labilithrix sp.]